MAVDLESLLAHRDPVVKARTRQAVAPQEGQEPFLQPAPGTPSGQGFYAVQRFPHSPHPASTRVSIDKVHQRKAVIQAQVFDLTDRTLDSVDRGGRGKVENRTRCSSHGDAVFFGSLIARQSDDVAMDRR